MPKTDNSLLIQIKASYAATPTGFWGNIVLFGFFILLVSAFIHLRCLSYNALSAHLFGTNAFGNLTIQLLILPFLAGLKDC